MTGVQSPSVFTAEQLANALAGNVRVIGRQVAGLTHADSLLQPEVRGNCLNWVLGHIAVHRDFMLDAFGQEKVLGDAALVRYDRESEPVLKDGPGVLHLEALLEALETAQERIETLLKNATSDGLSRPYSQDDPTPVAQHICFLYWHETYHVGQMEFLRQLAGTNDKVI
jgi:uncharacterized damage-inducible protein DinB